MPTENAVAVFTARSPKRIAREGGSGDWNLNPVRAKACTWLVCAQNRHNPDHDFSDATEPHGSGFLVGRISHVTPSGDRWIIQMSEYARIDRPDMWNWRNPVRYTSLEDLGIDVDTLTFEKMPDAPAPSLSAPAPSDPPPVGLTIAQAKNALASTYGVQPESIEIVIRG